MSELNADALRFLTEQAVVAAGPKIPVQVFEDEFVEAGHKPNIILAPGQQLTDVEHLYPGRARFRGQLTTSSLADFCGYTKERGVGRDMAVPVFIDADHMAAKAYFNLGDERRPGHADDLASLTLGPTAAYAAITQVAGTGLQTRQLDQRALAEFIEDWRENIQAFNGYDQDGAYTSTSIQKAVMAVRKVTIEAMNRSDSSVGDMSASQSTLASIEAKSSEGLPIALDFKCIPYEGLAERTFVLRVSVITGGKDPVFRLRIVRAEEHVEAMAQDFKSVLAKGLGDGAALTVGVFKP